MAINTKMNTCWKLTAKHHITNPVLSKKYYWHTHHSCKCYLTTAWDFNRIEARVANT